MIQGLPSVIIIRGLSHQRIGHGETTKTGIIQVTERVRRNLRNQLLHHGGPRQPLRQGHRRRNGTWLEHFGGAVKVGHGARGGHGGRIGGAIAVVLPPRSESPGKRERSEEREERQEKTKSGHCNGDEGGFRKDRENLHS